MDCEKCRIEMKNLGLRPNLGRKSLGKQFYKMQCPKCGKIKYVKPWKLN